MSRYVIISEWEIDSYDNPPFVYSTWDDETGEDHTYVVAVQTATIRDTKSSTSAEYKHGAYRVVLAEIDDSGQPLRGFKPIKAGKGGTVPFYGESAWSDAARLFNDEVFAARRMAW